MSLTVRYDYTTEGMTMPERSYVGGDYRYGFNGKEGDNEVSGQKNSYDFGARMYNPRLGRWMKVDALEAKYTDLSPYHFGYNSPIITIDIDGRENIIVVGSQSRTKAPHSDVTNPDFGQDAMGHNKRHFLEKGLSEAKRLFNEHTDGHESTTIIVYKSEYNEAELEHYKNEATKIGVNFIVAESKSEIVNYINRGDVTGKEDYRNPEGDRPDRVTDFSYAGHGNKDALWIGYGLVNPAADSEEAITESDFCSLAFTGSGTATLWGCNNGNNNGIACGLEGSDFFECTKGYEGLAWWGQNSSGDFGLGLVRDMDEPEAEMIEYGCDED